MDKFPVEITRYIIMKKTRTNDHIFCAGCGKEISRFDFKTGKMIQRQHYLCDTKIGVQLRYCWRRDNCNERRARKLGEKGKI